MDIYEGKCTCGDDDCTRTLVIEPAFRVSIVDETDELAVAEIMTRDQLLDWVGSDEAGVIQNARNELSIEPDAGAVWQWLDGNEAVDLRRQLAEAETALLAVPLDSIRRWMVHSDAIEAVAAGDYDAGEGMLDLYLIRDWLSGLATDATPATGEAESAMGTIRLTLQQLEDGQAESTNSPTDTPATGEAE